LPFITQNYFTQPISQGEEIMNEMPVTPSEEPKKSNTGIIIGVVVAVVLCCCCFAAIGGWWLWNNGDALLGSAQQFMLM
jgi:hypothetical protein